FINVLGKFTQTFTNIKIKEMKNYRILKVLLIATVAIILSSCSQKGEKKTDFEKVQHYRHLLFTETPWDQIRGANKISAEEAKNTNNYTFTYNDSLQLIQVDYCRGDSLLEYSRLGASRVVISYEDNREIRHYFNDKNEPVTVNGEVFKSVYEMDENGFRTGLKFYSKEDEQIENRNKIAYYTWSRTPMGMIKENRYTLAGEETVLNEFCPFYELRFSYDENGIVKRMANYEKDVLYDCTVENCGDIGVSYFDFTIDENGGLLEFSVHSTTGQLSNLYWGWARFKQKLDKNGYVIERETFDQDNEYVGGKMIPINQYTYDETGLLLEEKALDANRVLMNNPEDTVAVKQYKYDEFGRRTETILYDKDMVKKES
ncbi:hypothetical protein ACFLTE_05875, partial [Bacteroidota bacterium]